MSHVVERYVPTGGFALVSDAPGWKTDDKQQSGPTCWKCKGGKEIIDKKASRKEAKESKKKAKVSKKCPVCDGRGFLNPKKQEIESLAAKQGMITRRRRCNSDWIDHEPKSFAMKELEDLLQENPSLLKKGQPLYFLQQANSLETKDEGVSVPEEKFYEYPWFPCNKGEQLCNLVGSWRILQRVGSHRWTTDDIMTAYVALQELEGLDCFQRNDVRYIDLGCGNGSVLQMTSWGLLKKHTLKAFGIEARSEAAALARRSLTFNIGKDAVGETISVIHGDFRDLERHEPFANEKGINIQSQVEKFYKEKAKKFDLVTGTPPYFQVDFSVKEDYGEKVVTKAVINQGGMPSSIQSAPARCEFRGGVEEYCKAASRVLSDEGIFVVCENWLNNDRVYSGAEIAGLEIKTVYPVKGKSSRKEILFAVYVLQVKGGEGKTDVKRPIEVRDEKNKWTSSYADILEKMGIPARHKL